MKYYYKFIISFIVYLACSTDNAIAQADLQSGLIACYPFSGNAQDATGNGNHGTTVNGPVLAADRFGNANSAYKFDGIDDYVRLPIDNLKNENYTYSIWANISDLPKNGNNYAVWSIGNTNFVGAGDQFIMLGSNYVNSSQNGWYGGGYGSNGFVALKAVGSLPTINTWYHLATTRDKDIIKFYLNGQLVGTATTNGESPRYGGNPTSATVEARIGNRSPTLSGQNFKGIIDDFSIYNRTLSASEITALYNNSTCSVLLPPTLQDVSRCGSGQITLTATGGQQYKWYDAAINGNLLFTGSTFTTSLNGSRIFYVANFDGTRESTRRAVTATVYPIPAMPAANDVSRCGSGTVTLSATGGTHYHWYSDSESIQTISTSASFTTPNLSSSTTYYVSNFDGNCESPRKAVNVSILTPPGKPVVSLDGPAIFCTGSKVMLKGPEGYSTYIWSTGESTQNIMVAASGNYTLKVKNANGCESDFSDPVVIEVSSSLTPSVSIIASSDITCSEDFVTFTAVPIHGGNLPLYQWKVDDVTVEPTANSATLKYSFPKKERSYYANIAVEMSSSLTCVSENKVGNQYTIHVLPENTPLLSLAVSEDTICSDSEVTFTVNTNNENKAKLYHWKVNTVSQGEPTSSPTFKLSPSNRSSEPFRLEVSVEMVTNQYCTESVSAVTPVTVLSSPSVSCVIPETVEALSKNTYIAHVEGGKPPYSFHWNIANNEEKNTNDTITHTFSRKGTYPVALTVVDSRGCMAICNKHIKVKAPIHLPPNVFTPNGDNHNERFTIDYEGDEKFEMAIYNRWGKLIATISDGLQGWDGSGCPNGIYYYFIKVDDKQFKGWVQLLR
jgi:gliding motility-associated-like protein